MPASGSPYVGLIPYSDSDARLFFGRQREVEIIAANLMSRPVTVLFGPSGVGKSSILRAGLMHHLWALAGSADDGDGGFATAICSNWHDDPVRTLVEAVRAAVPGVDPEPSDDDLQRTLEEAVHRCGELFVVLDQFEEYFLYHGPGDDRFLANALRRAIADGGLPVSVLISLREDALAKLDRLAEIPRLLDNRVRIDHLGLDDAREAIEAPLAVFNSLTGEGPVTIEPELVEAVLDQVSIGRIVISNGEIASGEEARVEAAYLQIVMARLWDEEHGTGSPVLRLMTLERLGGANQIVRTHLSRSLNELSAGEREIAAEIFRYLVTPSGAKIAYIADDLAALAGRDVAEIRRVVDHLTHVRILRSVMPDVASAPRYELYHDLLVPAILDWSAQRSLQRERAEIRRLRAFVRALVVMCLVLGIALVVVAIHAVR
jgi:Novel STAND NTPase 1